MTKLYSYVVDHDHGFAPNPFGGFCTFAKCKFGYYSKGIYRRNIIEMAERGDWIAGTGGVDRTKSAGNGKLIYAMRVDETIPLSEYCRAHMGNRCDAKHDTPEDNRSALISHHFYYFGRNAVDLTELPVKLREHPFEKTGPYYRCDFDEGLVEEFAAWLGSTFKAGIHGRPCLPLSGMQLPKCPSQVRRKK